MTDAEILRRAMTDPECFVTPNAQPVMKREITRLSALLADSQKRETELIDQVSSVQLLEGKVAELQAECDRWEAIERVRKGGTFATPEENADMDKFAADVAAERKTEAAGDDGRFDADPERN